MRKGLMLLTALLAMGLGTHAQAQGFGGFLRSISNSLGGGSEKNTASGAATIGVRGMDEDQPNANGGSPAAADNSPLMKNLDTWAATKIEAEMAAKKKGLAANPGAKLAAANPPAGEPQ